MSDRLAECKSHYATLAPHVRGRRSSELFAWLIDEVERLRNENWPKLSNESREKLYHACKSAGVTPDSKWLSECAVEAIDLLRTEVERLRTIHTDTLATDMDFLCSVRLDAERWQYVREHGFDDVVSGPNWDGVWMLGENADAAVDAARKAT